MTLPARLATALADRYRIERELGAGGMAIVFQGYDLRLDRPVAIKVLRPELAVAIGGERFLAEIRTTAVLQHPHILPLFDSGVAGPPSGDRSGLLFYVMPLVEGESLRDLLAREKQLPVAQAVRIAREVASALDYAHRHDIVHRDIKPENILLHDGNAIVMDFGIALALHTAGGQRLTETGLALGTPYYMSPEQSMAERAIDGRSDVYALGCVLYEMLAGEPPYTGTTAHAIIAKRMTQPVPSVRALRETVPESIDQALTRALARSPVDRFTTSGEFSEALGAPADAPPGPRARRSRVAWAIGAAAGILALIGGSQWWHSHRPQVEPSASVIAVLPFLPSNRDTALTRLGRDLVLTISANLDGVGGIRVADPRLILPKADGSRDRSTAGAMALGRDLGAGSVVVGDILRVGPDIRLDLKLLATSGEAEPLARASIVAPEDSIGVLTDSVTWAILRQVWRRGDPPSPSYASLTTRSVVALRAFLDGERLSEAGRFEEAIDAYGAAIKADSTFWLAGWRYNSTQGWILEADPDTVLERGYRSHLSAFGEVDRLLIETAMIISDTITEGEALARLRAITERFPGDWRGWSAYADELAHWGPIVGYTNADTRAALQRAVDLNPRLVPMWDHLFGASAGHDSAQAELALRSLTSLGEMSRRSARRGYDATLSGRLLLAANGPLPATVLDSLAAGVPHAKGTIEYLLGHLMFLMGGHPRAQVVLNQRLLATEPSDVYAHIGLAYSWAARGAWDSALISFDRAIPGHPPEAVLGYQSAVSGAWLGGLDTARVAGRRAAAVKYLASLPPDSAAAHQGRAQLLWADGMLAVLRRDLAGLADARTHLRLGGSPPFLDRSLAGFELALRGAKRAAADSLAALDLTAPNAEVGEHDAFAMSLNHLAASRLLLELGDSSAAARQLTWHEATPGGSWTPVYFQPFAALAYYELARIEGAQGRSDLARDHYQQFLWRYDMPAPAHQHLVDEARAALERYPRENAALR